MEGFQSDKDVQLVIDLELKLLQPQIRTSAAELEKLLDADFFEFGAAARRRHARHRLGHHRHPASR
jgi:hypothetical protein